MEQKRIKWIDGLRGIASICIVLHHFIIGYYPAAYEGATAMRHLPGSIEADFSQSPLSFFVVGDFWVSVFCMVSGFVIASQVFAMKDGKQFSKSVMKRYPRLMIPVFALSAIVYVMLHLGLFYNVQAANITGSSWLGQFYQYETTLWDLFFSSMIDTWIVGMETMYSNAFWMMAELFAGSFMAYLLAAMGKHANKRILYVYIGIALAYLSVNSRLTDFVLGVLLAYVALHYGEKICQRERIAWILGVVFVVIAVIFGAYPHTHEPTNAYQLLNCLPSRLNPCYFYHMLGAMFLVMGIYLCRPVKWLMSTRPALFLGKISYAVYVIHIPILFSLTAWMFVRFTNLTKDYNISAGLALVLSLLAIVLLGWVFWRLVERPSTKWIGKAVDKLTEDITEIKE